MVSCQGSPCARLGPRAFGTPERDWSSNHGRDACGHTRLRRRFSQVPTAREEGGECLAVHDDVAIRGAGLALALGLSDLASNKVQIQSLFIDEGFGTLDAETLDVAMDALENLREAGKSIGVISHVEAMKERITTQIQVVRTAGGYSRIEIKG